MSTSGPTMKLTLKHGRREGARARLSVAARQERDDELVAVREGVCELSRRQPALLALLVVFQGPIRRRPRVSSWAWT